MKILLASLSVLDMQGRFINQPSAVTVLPARKYYVVMSSINCLIAVYKSETPNSLDWRLRVPRQFRVVVMKERHAVHPISVLSRVK